MMEAEKDYRHDIMESLEKADRNLNWLSKKTSIPYSTLYSIFVHKIYNLTEEQKELLEEARLAQLMADDPVAYEQAMIDAQMRGENGEQDAGGAEQALF